MVADPREDEAVEEDDDFRCAICDATFDTQQELQNHGNQAHQDHDPKEDETGPEGSGG
jgi:uncharacterized C2H2 Zn-finger protein